MKGIAILAAVAFVAITTAQLAQKDLVGNWEGESKCVNLKAAPACKDEHVIYHITPTAKQPNHVTINADKIVNKVALPMGEIILKIDSKGSAINNEMTINGNKLIWNFVIKGNKMTGTLKDGNQVVIRRISLTAQKKA